MLRTLAIENVILISRLDIDFTAGLCVLTGETGAGKSILLDALGLALGERASASLVRPGAKQASVSAIFEIAENHPAAEILRQHDISLAEDLILRRVVNSEGKSKAYINDNLVSVSLLKLLARDLIEIHGQFDQLLQPAQHRNILDKFIGCADLLGAVAGAHKSYKEVRTKLLEAEKFISEQKNQQEFLKCAVDEFDQISPEVGEEDGLLEKKAILQNQSKIVDGVSESLRLLGRDQGILDNFGSLLNTLEKVDSLCPEKLKEVLAGANRAYSEILEIESGINSFKQEVDSGSTSLESVEDRLYELKALARKHGCLVAALPDVHQKFKAELALLTGGESNLDKLRSEVKEAEIAYLEYAKKLSQLRQKEALKLSKAVEQELKPLKLEKAELQILVENHEQNHWGETGIDHVEFLVKTNPGLPFGSIEKVASGGERSRLMLAFKVVLVDSRCASILVFDEIDSGVGGAVASAIGERMARLGQGQQVLAITHSPQVASYANCHMLVEKSQSKDNSTHTDINVLSDAERKEEIARMLSGDQISTEARAAADKLLSIAKDASTRKVAA